MLVLIENGWVSTLGTADSKTRKCHHTDPRLALATSTEMMEDFLFYFHSGHARISWYRASKSEPLGFHKNKIGIISETPIAGCDRGDSKITLRISGIIKTRLRYGGGKREKLPKSHTNR